MSLLLFDGEVIEIPDYIIRIVNKAQEIVASDADGQRSPVLNLLDVDVLSKFRTDDSEPLVIGTDGCKQTVSEYILTIIRAAQKIITDEPTLEDDIKDYDEFIDNTFDSMLEDEASSDTDEDSSVVIQDVVEKLIDEVCSTEVTMPETETSLVTTTQEDERDETDDHQIFEQQGNAIPISDDTNKIEKSVNEDETIITNNDKTGTGNSNTSGDDEASDVNIKKVHTESFDNSDKELVMESQKTDDSNEEGMTKVDDKDDESKNIPTDTEFERVAEKFVETICNDVKNELFIEEENKNNEIADSNNDIEICKEKDVENKSPMNGKEMGTTIDTVNGQLDPKQEDDPMDNKLQNHTAKVHPEETKPVVANIDDITDTESLPTGGKHGKEQKNDVSKDKIKPKRRARGLRNSFRRMFSCFSTKSSQLE